MEEDTKNNKEISTNLFEQFLKGLKLKFDPKTLTLTVGYPSSSIKDKITSKEIAINNPAISSGRKPPTLSSSNNNSDDNLDLGDLDLDLKRDLDEFSSDEVITSTSVRYTKNKPTRVKIHFKAYIKMALHALKYANSNISRDKWVEIIGLLTGYIENKDNPKTCLVITDAYPIGHGTNVNAWIRNPQSHVKVYKKLKGEIILGWYHSHPGYSPFMSKTDFETQVRYQKLGSKNPYESPVALVIDHTQISKNSYGFKIFRLDPKLRKWEEPKYEVIDCPLDSLPNMLKTLLPLTEGKGLFLEYDHE